jgi:hypothetical protein
MIRLSNREFRLNRHQRMMTKMGQAKEIFDQIFLPEKPVVERAAELRESVNDIPEDVQLISTFMVFVDDISLNFGKDADKVSRIFRNLKIIIGNYPQRALEVLDKLGGEIAAGKKTTSKTMGYM